VPTRLRLPWRRVFLGGLGGRFAVLAYGLAAEGFGGGAGQPDLGQLADRDAEDLA
jgi:hypothetical protein